MENKRVSIHDVAAAAGVSITTVSRVMNKVPTVSDSNRAKVEEAIRVLRFTPSPYAQALARGSVSNTIAFIIPRYEGIFYSFYALELIRGVGALCDAFKTDLLLHLTDSLSDFNSRSVSGIIFADIIGNRFQVEAALKAGVPTVVINNLVEDLEVDCVAVDNLKGAKDAVNYLAGLGHKKIAHISGDLISQSAALRLEGYRQALAEAGITEEPDYIVKTDYSRGEARQATESLLALKNPPTAIFAASDSMALEALNVIREKGKSVPGDISIIGFDDNPSGLYGAVALTTVRQPLTRMAEEGVKELHELMGGRAELRRIKLPPELVIRDSCRQIN